MSSTTKLIKLLVEGSLRRPHAHDWTIQGMGMLRTYLSREVRLHIWDSRYKVPKVSMVHTHPWDFTSIIIAGQMSQYRYFRHGDAVMAQDFKEQRLRCGAGGGLCGEPSPVKLYRGWLETYKEGESYQQVANEIHESEPEDGTVTLVMRTFKEDDEHASVFFEDEWGSAEPRPATGLEVMDITRQALHRWFSPNPNYI